MRLTNEKTRARSAYRGKKNVINMNINELHPLVQAPSPYICMLMRNKSLRIPMNKHRFIFVVGSITCVCRNTFLAVDAISELRIDVLALKTDSRFQKKCQSH